MLLQPVPALTRLPNEKIETLTWRTNAQDFRFIPLSDLAPGFGPPCPWLDMDYCCCDNNCGDPVVTHTPNKDMRCR